MKISRATLSAAAVGCVLALAVGCSSKLSMPKAAAVVGGTEIPSADVETMTARYMAAGSVDAEHPPLPIADARRTVLDFLIKFAVLKNLANKYGVPPVNGAAIDAAIATLTPEELAQTNLEPSDIRQSVEAGELSRRLANQQFPNVAVSDYEISQTYEKAKDRFVAGWSAVVRVAYFTKKETADAFVAKAPTIANFDDTARGLGATKVGSMGTVSNADAPGQSVLDLLATLPALQLSEPLLATGGFLVFIIESRSDTPGKTVAQARPELLGKLQDQKRQALFEDWFAKEMKSTKISVNKFYGRWSPDRGYTEP